MTHHLLRRLVQAVLLVAAALWLAGCDTGYQQVDGEWVFVTLDEGQGRQEHPIVGADAATFEKIGRSGFARDRARVYYRGQPLAGADAPTFENLKGNYWKDKARVYYFNEPLDGADPATYRLVRGDWGRDDHNYYVGADAVNPRDIATFEILNNTWARDSQWYYPAKYAHYNAIAELDRATFRILDGGWAKDCCRVYYYERIVEGADAATFEVVNDVRGRDKNNYYLTGFQQRTVQEEEALKQREAQPR